MEDEKIIGLFWERDENAILETKTKYGKRMPYIILGMAATCLIFPFMALCYIWNSLVGLIIVMLLVLIVMNIYRSPAVALMPDVTPKPLRSSANGLINLVGYFGPIVISVVNMIPAFTFSQGDKNILHILVPVIVVLLSVIAAIVILVLKINEPKILEEVAPELKLGEELSTAETKVEEDEPLTKRDRINMWILLAAVCLWFMAFNAMETFNSTYADNYFSTYEEVVVSEDEFAYDDWDEIDIRKEDYDLDDPIQREKYVRCLLEQIGEAEQTIQSLTAEYASVTSYLKDMEEIEALPAAERDE